jgi:hypothetical protein
MYITRSTPDSTQPAAPSAAFLSVTRVSTEVPSHHRIDTTCSSAAHLVAHGNVQLAACLCAQHAQLRRLRQQA